MKLDGRTVLIGIIILLVVLVFVVPSEDRTLRPQAQAAPMPCASMECNLATIESQRPVAESDATTARMRTHLSLLAGAYPETREQIGDMTVKLQQILAAQGQTETLESLLVGFETLPHPVQGVPHYAEATAMYAVLRQRGSSHASAVTGLSAMLRDLGRLR